MLSPIIRYQERFRFQRFFHNLYKVVEVNKKKKLFFFYSTEFVFTWLSEAYVTWPDGKFLYKIYQDLSHYCKISISRKKIYTSEYSIFRILVQKSFLCALFFAIFSKLLVVYTDKKTRDYITQARLVLYHAIGKV